VQFTAAVCKIARQFAESVRLVFWLGVSSRVIVAKLAALGLDIHYVDVQSILLPSDMYDNVHPNDSGHLKIKNAILPVLTA